MANLVSYALTSVADVKESLGISSGDHTKDNLITRKINQATDAIEAYCQRRFALTQYIQEEYKASQIDEMVLRQRPVLIDDTHTFLAEWRSTAFNNGTSSNGWETIDTQLYFVDSSAGVLNLMYNALGHWNRYRFSYWAGYATIPNDLAEACSMLAAYYTNNPAGYNAYVIARSEGSRQTRFVTHSQKSFYLLMSELGIDAIINSYADDPVLADR